MTALIPNLLIHKELFNVRTPALSPREIDKPCWSGDGSFGYSDQSQDALKQGSLKDIVDFFSRYRRGTQWGGDRWQADIFEQGDVMAALLRLKEFSYDRNSPTTASIPLR